MLADVYDTRAGLNFPKQDIEAYGGAIRAELKLGDHVTLRNIIAYRKDRTSHARSTSTRCPRRTSTCPAIYRNKQLSNELQLLYESDRLKGLVGFYYLDAKPATSSTSCLATTGAVIGLPGFTASTFGDVDTKTWAAFADFTYDFSDQFSCRSAAATPATGGRRR